MESLNFVNLIQAATLGVSALGGFLLWRKSDFRGIAFLLWLTAVASGINILEETGITRDIYLISPIFIMLLGPATYLAAKHLTTGSVKSTDWIHLLPVVPVLFFTSHIETVIAIGTVWRLVYVLFTVRLLILFKKSLDEQRSDSDDFSLRWFTFVVVGTTLFNLIDLVRLNSQSLIPYELNVLGQGINNGVWLIAAAIIVIKLLDFKLPPELGSNVATAGNSQVSEDDYQSAFTELDSLITTNQWFLQPRLTLSDVSELTGLQTRDISRAINTVTHKSFNEYINEYRVKQICEALDKQSSVSLTRLYTDAGFSSKASFNKVFKEFKGLTPSQYKSQVSTGSGS